MGWSEKYEYKFKDRKDYFRKRYELLNPSAKKRRDKKWETYLKVWSGLSAETKKTLKGFEEGFKSGKDIWKK